MEKEGIRAARGTAVNDGRIVGKVACILSN